jgi:hypothetical protein
LSLDRSSLEALAGGRCPANYGREVARLTGRLAFAVRACEWIEDITRIDPRLLCPPLLGRALEELTGTAPAADASMAGRTKYVATGVPHAPASVQQDGIEMPRHRRNAMRRESTGGVVSGPAGTATPVEMPRRAEAQLLRRLAEDSELPASIQVSRRRPRLPETERPAGANHAPFADAGPRSRREFLSGVAERAERLFREFQAEAAGLRRRVEPLKSPAVESPAEGAQDTEAHRAVLVRQWSSAVTGQTASAQTFARLAADSVTSARLQSQRDATAQRPTRMTRAEESSAPGVALGAESQESSWKEGQRRGFAPLPAAERANPEWAVSTEPRRVYEHLARAGEDPPVTPPGHQEGAASQPEVPVHELYRSLPASLARTKAQPALALEEDMNALASRIKTILEEEARRHGIDV